MKFENKKIVITGGSAGIGEALLKEFIDRGARDFAIVARRIGPLEELKTKYPDVSFLLISADIGDFNELKTIEQKISKEWGSLDILINNAGVVSAGLLEDVSEEDIIAQININVTGLILLTKYLLPLLKKSDEGAIINISSGLGYIARPFYSVYAATKAAVRQFSDAMRRELHEFPIHVMTSYPTATDTPMMKHAKVSKQMDSPEDVAKGTVDGLESGELNVIFGGQQRLEDIETNFHNPKDIDKKTIANFDAMRERTKNHRAM